MKGSIPCPTSSAVPPHPLVIVGAGPIGLAAAAARRSRAVCRPSSSRPAPRRLVRARVGSCPALLGVERAGRPRGGGVAGVRRGGTVPTPTATPPAGNGSRAYLAPLASAVRRPPARSRSGWVAAWSASPSRAATGWWTPAGTRPPFTVLVEDDRRHGACRGGSSSTRPAPGPDRTRWVPTACPRSGEARARRPDHLRHPGLRRPGGAARYAGKRVAVAGRGPRRRTRWSGWPPWPRERRAPGRLAAASPWHR